MFVGALYKSPDLYVTYGNFMRPKYDFSDEVVYFFYKCLETYYLKFSQTVDETKLNVFMSQDAERMSNYKKYHGWKTISEFMRLADSNDIKNYFDTVKKYSLVREYGRNGYPVDKILAHKNFDKMTANDIYRVIRAKADKIHTVINAGEEAVELTKGNADQIKRYLKKPNFGLPYPWPMYNEFFLGMREGKTHFEGFISNGGKSRKLIALAAYVTLVQHKNFLLMSNEMDEDDLKNCMIVTVINNKEYQELHGIKIKKPEREIVLGAYRDRNGEIIRSLKNFPKADVTIPTDKMDEYNKYYNFRNIYKTKEEAEFEVERRKVMIELQNYADEHNGETAHPSDAFWIAFDEDDMSITVETESYLPPVGAVLFSDADTAYDAIEAIGENRILEYMFRVNPKYMFRVNPNKELHCNGDCECCDEYDPWDEEDED